MRKMTSILYAKAQRERERAAFSANEIWLRRMSTEKKQRDKEINKCNNNKSKVDH